MCTYLGAVTWGNVYRTVYLNQMFRPAACKADFFVVGGTFAHQLFFTIPLFLLLLSKRCREAGRIQRIVRMKSRGTVWQERIRQTLWLAICFTFIMGIALLAASVLSGYPTCNWQEKYSLFWLFNGETVCPLPRLGLWENVVAFLATQVSMFAMVGMLFTFVQFVTSREWASWLLCMAFFLYRKFGSDRGGVFYRVTMDYRPWKEWTMDGKENIFQMLIQTQWAQGILMAVAVVVLLGIIGYFYVKRKEFLNER